MLRPLLLLAVLASASCVRHPELRIDGSPGVAPLVAALAEAYREANPRAPVRMASGLGSSARSRALLDDRIDIAMASHGIDTAALRGRGITAHEIARTAVVFAVHGDVARTDVSSAVVCDIYAGRVGGWADGLRISPLMRPANEVDAEVALATIPCLKDVTYAASVRLIERADDMAAELAARRGAFGLTSLPYVRRGNHRIRAVALNGVEPTEENVRSGRYPMTRRAILLVREPASPAAARFLAFARSERGQRVLRASGAVPTP